jgi:AraC-like DNA-binding protein
MDEKTASDIFYTSATFVRLSDRTTGLYLKSWQEIYEMLKKELNL